MSVFIYKVLTQGIIILGRMREKVEEGKTVIRNDRVFVDPQVLRYFICCDCGLAHTIDPHNEAVNFVRPVRIEDYDYLMRRFAVGGYPFPSEAEALASLTVDN